MKKQQEIIAILVSGFILTCIWIVLNLYHDAVTSTLSQQLNIDIMPITPSFNTGVITELKKRTYIGPQYTFSQQPTPTSTPSTIPTTQNNPTGTP